MRPLCKCHDAEMYWNKDKRLRAGGFWYCSVKFLARQRERYATDVIYRLTQINGSRRSHALKRRRERQLRRADPSLGTEKKTRQTFDGTGSAAG